MPVSASRLREDVYRILDSVLETGDPVEIIRKGRVLRIVAVETPSSRLEKLAKNADSRAGVILCDPEQLVETDWSGEWKPDV